MFKTITILALFVAVSSGCTWKAIPNQRGQIDGATSWGSMPQADDCKSKCEGDTTCLSVDTLTYADGHVDCYAQTVQANVDNPVTVHVYNASTCGQQSGPKYYPGPDGTCWVTFTHLWDQEATGGNSVAETADYHNCLKSCASNKDCVGIDTVFSKKTVTVQNCIIHTDSSQMTQTATLMQHICD